jgi:SAM-dependent methyltransferase
VPPFPVPSLDDAYDRLPYTDHAYAESHPDRLAVVARLSGWLPPAVENARVLELGCGRGGNLLPMAATLPGATLVGVDRSARQIEEARRIAAATALGNVAFVAASFEAFERRPASADFVIAHGLCSWIAPDARRALLHTMARALAPDGVAYVSFNVLPGWYERLAARDWLRSLDATPREARASVEWLRDHVSPELPAYRDQLGRVAARLAETDPAYAAHEYLADEHHPQLARDFLAEADAAGLRYLGDAIPASTAFELLAEDVAERARGLDVVAAQQLVDFVRCTAFRRALLVRADTCEARGWRWSSRLDGAGLASLRVASRLIPHRAGAGAGAGADARTTEAFEAGDEIVQVHDPSTRRALHELSRVAPASVDLPELARRSGDASGAHLASELFDLWLATSALDLHVHQPCLASTPAERPLACPVARWHASNGGAITNRWHQEVRLDDDVLRLVLARLDGTRTAADLERELHAERFARALTGPELHALVAHSLAQLASSALLVA